MLFSKYKSNYIVFVICILLLFIILFLLVNSIEKKENNRKNYPYTSIIDYSDDKTNIYVEYPRFNNDNINNIITNVIYNYIKTFKNNNKKKKLIIRYDLFYIDKYVNIQFYIDNSLENIKYKNILLNIKDSKISYITDLFDENSLKESISSYDKKVLNKSLNSFTYIIENNTLYVIFSNIKEDIITKIGINLNEIKHNY